jgi:uncharacterized membrane protein YphA (DoxX/SURF4 family)
MLKWRQAWNAFWFPETTTLYLAICRIVVVATQLWWFFPPTERNIELLKWNTEFVDPQFFIVAIATIFPYDLVFTPESFAVIRWVTIVAGLTAIIGLFTRISVLVFALGIWFFVAHRYSYSDIHHPEGVFCIFLLLLAFVPSHEHLSLDAWLRRRRRKAPHRWQMEKRSTVIWPLKLVHALLAITYFSTGISKLMYGGLQWLNGYTIQTYIFKDALERGRPLGLWIANQHELSILLSIYTVLFELCFPISIFVPRTLPFFLVGGILFQIGLYTMAGHPFFQHIVLLSLLLPFIDYDRWEDWLYDKVHPIVKTKMRPN